MLDIGGLELLLIAVVALLVIGPERLPETLRTLGLWLGRLRRSFTSVKAEIEKEIGMDEIKRQLHNESVMAEMKRIESEVKRSVDDVQIDPHKIDPHLQESDSAEPSEPMDADGMHPRPIEQAEDTPPEPEAPLPKTEAQVEAAYERKLRAQQAASKDNS